MSFGTKYLAAALLVMGSASAFYSCKEEKKDEVQSLETVMTDQAENFTLVLSENGRLSYRITTPLMEGYTLARDPYREFRKGIRIVTYEDDSISSVKATLTANYAISYENRKLYEAKGNVEIRKNDGTTVYTQQMFWNQATHRIYSNVDTKLVTATDTYFTEGFESDEELNDLRFRHWSGKMQFDDSVLENRDSIAETNPEPKVEGASASAGGTASPVRRSVAEPGVKPSKPERKASGTAKLPVRQTKPKPKPKPAITPAMKQEAFHSASDMEPVQMISTATIED